MTNLKMNFKIKTMEINRKQLINAFKKWNSDFIKNQDDFCEIDDSKEIAERQADTLLSYL